MSNTDSLRKTSKSKKVTNKNDPDRFTPPGLNFRGKLIGVEDVPEARGDKMCQVAMAKVKAAVRTIGDHKQRIIINVSLDGIKIIDEKSEEVIHKHIVQRISFIARDVSDARAFGYVYGSPDGRHQFYGIKTEKVAEGIVLSLRDLFQTVFDMKKREVDETKKCHDETASNNKLNFEAGHRNVENDSTSYAADSYAADCELDNMQQGLDHLNAYLPPSLSTSPGGNSWPMSHMWGGLTPPLQDKYNTLPPGSAAVYRSMFAPVSVRANSLRLQQTRTEEDDVSSTNHYENSSAAPLSGTVPRVGRVRNKSTSSLQRPFGSHQYSIPPPASVPSTRRSTASLSSMPSSAPAVDSVAAPATVTGWAQFDLSPLSESTHSETVVTAVNSQSADDAFKPHTDTNNSPVTGFADFPSPDVQKDLTGVNNNHPVSSPCAFADSFVCPTQNSNDAIKSADTNSAPFDLMSPSSDRDSLSLPSPEAPPPPLPSGTVELPLEPPVPPPRPRARASSRVSRNLETGFGSNHSTPVHSTDQNSVEVSSQPLETRNMAECNAAQQAEVPLQSDQSHQPPFEFPPDDLAPPPPPRPASMSAVVRQPLTDSAVDCCVAPPPPPRRSVITPSTTDPFAPIPNVSVVQPAVSSPTHDTAVIETTISPLPRPRPHVKTSSGVSESSVAFYKKTGDLPAGCHTSPWEPADGSNVNNFSPWQPVESVPLETQVSASNVIDPFVNVDPFAADVTPDDPFAEPSLNGFLANLSHDFEPSALQSTTFRTRAVTIDSVSSDILDTDWSAGALSVRPDASNGSRSAGAVPVKQDDNVQHDVDVGCLIDLSSTEPSTTSTLTHLSRTDLHRQPSFDAILSEFDERFPAFDDDSSTGNNMCPEPSDINCSSANNVQLTSVFSVDNPL